MKKHSSALKAWCGAHKPFLKLVTFVIVVGLAVNLALYTYGYVMLSTIEAQIAQSALETKAYEELAGVLEDYRSSPRVIREAIVEGDHYRMEKISAAGSPDDTWHMVGWRETDAGEYYRLEGCFAAPPASDNQSN